MCPVSSKETLQLIIHWTIDIMHFNAKKARETQEDSPRTLRFLATDINHRPSKNWSSQNKVEPTEVLYAICYGILLLASTKWSCCFFNVFLLQWCSNHPCWTCHWWTSSQIFMNMQVCLKRNLTWVSLKVAGMPMAFFMGQFDFKPSDLGVSPSKIVTGDHPPVWYFKFPKTEPPIPRHIQNRWVVPQFSAPGPGAFKTRLEPPRLLRPSGALVPAPPGNLTWMINVQENMSEIRKQPSCQ